MQRWIGFSNLQTKDRHFLKSNFMKRVISILPIILSYQLGAQQLFEPNVISIPGQHDDYITVSPKEDFLLLTRLTDDYGKGTIYISEKKNGKWTMPEIVSFSGTYDDSRPFISPQGDRVFFVSDRPAFDRPIKSDLDIWYVDKTVNSWTDPVNAGNNINTTQNDSHPSVAGNGNLYFSRWGSSPNDIYRSEFKNGVYQLSEPIQSINTEKSESHAFIAPDESFLFFGKTIDQEGMNGQVFISINKNGQWSKPMSFDEVNSSKYDYSAKLNAARNRIYFSSTDFTSGGERADIYYVDVNWEEIVLEYSQNAVYPELEKHHE
jgi:Tol biopolymer transport system component